MAVTRSKGTKIIDVAARNDLPVAIHLASASPDEVTLVPDIVEDRFVADTPDRLNGGQGVAYDRGKLGATLKR